MDLANNALTTLEAVREYLQIPMPDTSKDDLFKRLINAASDLIERYCQRSFKKATHTETHYNTEQYVFVRNYPVLSISSITDNGTALTAAELAECRNHGTFIELDIKRSGPIVIVYEAGFVLPKDENLTASPPVVRTLPYDLEQACIMLTQYYYKTDISNYSTVFAESGAVIRPDKMPGHVVKILERYAKVV